MIEDMRDLIAADLMRKQAEAEKKANKHFQEQPATKTGPKSTGDELLDAANEQQRKLDEANRAKIAAIRDKAKIPLTPDEKKAFRSTYAAEQSAKRRGDLEQAEAEAKAKRQKEIDDLLGL